MHFAPSGCFGRGFFIEVVLNSLFTFRPAGAYPMAKLHDNTETNAILARIEKLLYATITLLIFVIIKDSPTVSGLFAKLLAKLFS